MGRTFAIGDIHGDLEALHKLFAKFPPFEADDTIVFLGDYVDRGPHSADVVEFVRTLSSRVPAKIVALRGNHEDGWLRVVEEGWIEFIVPRGNGCLETYRSFKKLAVPAEGEPPSSEELVDMARGEFFPPEVVEWMRGMPFWHEDEHALYVHAGLARKGDAPFPHPRDVEPQRTLLWVRSKDFFANYRGKIVVFGHTTTDQLPNDLSNYTPDDPNDLWAGPAAIGLDTGAGKGGFLTAIELPKQFVYESR